MGTAHEIIQPTIPKLIFNLHEGDHIELLRGLPLETDPLEIYVLHEYAYFYTIFIRFRDKPRGTLSIGYRTAINKASIYAGQIQVKKKSGENVRGYLPTNESDG